MLYTTQDYKQTQKIGEDFALRLCSGQAKKDRKSAIVIGLSGNLGGGKTTFLQGFAEGLGITEKVLSPTFVILKRFKNFYHIDCYRLNKDEEILELGWKEIISDPKNIVAIEWPEKIKKYLPKDTIYIKFDFVDENQRKIQFIEKGGLKDYAKRPVEKD